MEAVSERVVELGFGPATGTLGPHHPDNGQPLDFRLPAASPQEIIGIALARDWGWGSCLASIRTVN